VETVAGRVAAGGIGAFRTSLFSGREEAGGIGALKLSSRPPSKSRTTCLNRFNTSRLSIYQPHFGLPPPFGRGRGGGIGTPLSPPNLAAGLVAVGLIGAPPLIGFPCLPMFLPSWPSCRPTGCGRHSRRANINDRPRRHVYNHYRLGRGTAGLIGGPGRGSGGGRSRDGPGGGRSGYGCGTGGRLGSIDWSSIDPHQNVDEYD